MRMLDLFSGIGGFALAGKWVWGDDLDIVGFCEIEEFAQKVLKKNFPGVPIYDDITKLDGNQFNNIDILTGGFPCQDISLAGKGKGLVDEKGDKTRSGLWFEMHRIIREVRPRFALIENVPMLTIRGGTRVIADLASIGYDCEWTIIGADDVGARHRRKRIWIVAYPTSNGFQKRYKDDKRIIRKSKEGRMLKPSRGSSSEIVAYPNDKRVRTRIGGTDVYNEKESGAGDYNGGGGTGDVERNNPETPKNEKMEFPNTSSTRREVGLPEKGHREKGDTKEPDNNSDRRRRRAETNYWKTEPKLGRVANGIPNRVDRLKGIGNAIVPQVAELIMNRIKKEDRNA